MHLFPPLNGTLVSIGSISAGTTLASLGQVVFSNSNGVSFGVNGQTVTASVASNSLSNIRVSAGTTSNLLSAMTFSNSNNVSFGLNASTITGSFALNASGGTTSNNLSNIVFSNSNLVSFGLNGSTLTAQHALNFSAGTTSNIISSQLIFSNSNNVSFGLNGSTITASATVASSQNSINFSAGTTSNNVSNIVFSNANGVSFGINGSTVTGSVTSQSINTLSFYEYPSGALAALHNVTMNVLSIQPIVLPAALSATVADLFASVVLTTSGTSNTSYSGSFTWQVGLYSMNAGTLSLSSSNSQTFSYSYTSNISSSNLSGIRKYTIPFNVNISQGNWWYAGLYSFAAGSGSISQQIVGANNQAVANYSGAWGSSVNASNQLSPYAGIYTATTGAFPSAINVSDIAAGNGNATQNAARPTYIIFRNISAAI